ncbi:cytochrome c oxidase accessory protein CcoG [Alphaproteobacteria bacterium LSUCC0684]
MAQKVSTPSLYAAREPVFPRRVKGRFRTLKWWIMGVTLGIYYLTPWIRFDRGPDMPDQAVLVDLAGRRFFMFWIEIWPHEFYFVAGLLIMAGIGLFLFTSALGRVWCGYACPQTVWTDLFILVERWIDGDRNARIRLWSRKWDPGKIAKRLFKWSLWLLIGMLTGGAWVFYFADAPSLAASLWAGTAPPVAWASIGVLTATTFVFGGFMREQVCTYMCPWPRIQAAMMDEDTLTIGYRSWRGEPRARHQRRMDAEAHGDCIDCNACFNVCPMGIDIRDGQQLQCITCALCIDACDDVMRRLGRPRGLIDYMALSDEANERAGGKPRPAWRHIFRPRTILYTVIWSLIGVALVYGLFIRSDLEFSVAPVRNPVFVTLADGTIRNIYELRLRNKSPEVKSFIIGIDSEFSDLKLSLGDKLQPSVTVMADSTYLQRVYVLAEPKSRPALTATTPITFWVADKDGGRTYHVKSVFNGEKR